MLATHHIHSYFYNGEFYQEDKKNPGQYISEVGKRFFLYCGKLFTSEQIKKIEDDSPNNKTIEDVLTTP